MAGFPTMLHLYTADFWNKKTYNKDTSPSACQNFLIAVYTRYQIRVSYSLSLQVFLNFPYIIVKSSHRKVLYMVLLREFTAIDRLSDLFGGQVDSQIPTGKDNAISFLKNLIKMFQTLFQIQTKE